MTNEMPPTTARAIEFLERGHDLMLTDEEIIAVLDDAIDTEPTTENSSINYLLRDARSRFTSDDDYDDFCREVRGVVAGDDACLDCGYDVDGDCLCDDDDVLDPSNPDYDLFNE